MPLFAEVPDWAVWVVAVVIGPAVTWVAGTAFKWRDKRRAERQQDKKEIVDHQADLIKTQGKEINKLQTRADENDRLVQALRQHVGYMEGLLTGLGQKFKPFSYDGIGDTDLHRSLKQEGSP